MTFRRRLGVLAIAVSGLVAAALLLCAPAYAWQADVTALETGCPSGSSVQTRVAFALTPSPSGHSGNLEVAWSIDGRARQQVPPSELLDERGQPTGTFGPDDTTLRLHFLVPSPREGGSQITVFATTSFDGTGETARSQAGPVAVALCMSPQRATSTTAVASGGTDRAAAASVAPPSTAAPLGRTATTALGSSPLPGTGRASSLPLVIAAVVLVVGGGGVLVATRVRGRQAR
jgi:hypothetical protein